MCGKVTRTSGDRHENPAKLPEEREQDWEVELLYSFVLTF